MASDMDYRDKLQIHGRLLEALRELRATCEDPVLRDQAEDVIEFAANALLGRQNLDGQPLSDPERIYKMWRILNGGRAIRDVHDAIGTRHLGELLESGANTLQMYPETPRVAIRSLRYNLAGVDEALVALDDETLLAALRDLADKKMAITGVIADLLRAAQALGTEAGEDRGRVQQRVTSALKTR